MLKIREMSVGDKDEENAVIDLWIKCGLTRPWNDPQKDLSFALAQQHASILVGYVDEKLMTSVMVGHDGHRGTVYYLSVNPEFQGVGFGRKIMTAAEEWLLAKGVWKVNLLVRTGNEKTLAFYDNIGYSKSETLVLERWIDPSKRGKAQE